MKEITEAIDVWTEGNFNHTLKLWGYCELMTKSGQVMPVTIPERQQVSLDDRFEVMTWIRLTGGPTPSKEIEGNDWGFGLNDTPVQIATLRLVIAHKVIIGEDFIIDFVKRIPRSLTVDGYSIVSINKPGITVDPDHEAIYLTELGPTVYEKHRFDWNLYALSIPVEFIPCEVEQ